MTEPTPLSNTGVVYLPTLSPHITPDIARRLLSPFGEIDRIFFRPMPSDKKKKSGKLRYIDGWIEFKNKKVARAVAEMLNGKQIGGDSSTKNPYYHDFWTIRYLPKFKWTHLTERGIYRSVVKQQQLQADIRQSKRENELLLSSMDRSRMLADKVRRQTENEQDLSQVKDKVYSKSNIHRDYSQKTVGKRQSNDSISSVINLLKRKNDGE
ncbi:hypothetical protein RCL1_000682 [Eukaryota sp. TZLM3-RCL]